MLPRRERAAVLSPAIILLLAAAAAAEAEALPIPMEVYFTAAELARIAGYGEEPVSSVSVSGQLTCELCLRPGSDLLTLEMPAIQILTSNRWRVGDACFYVHKQATQPDRKATSRRAGPVMDAAQRHSGSPEPLPQHSGHGRRRTRHRRRCSSPLHNLLTHPRSRGGTTIADWRYADAACFSSWLRMLMLDASKSIIAGGPAASPKLPPPLLPGPPASASTSRRLVYSTPPLLPLLLQLDGRDRTAARGGRGRDDGSSGWVSSSASMVNIISCLRLRLINQTIKASSRFDVERIRMKQIARF